MSDWAVIHSSRRHDWRTPRSLFDKLDEEFRFGLDAAASSGNALCSRYLSESDNSLEFGWGDLGVTSVWLNPPYGRGIHLWVSKAIEESRRGMVVVMLLFACTDTKWWIDIWRHSSEIRFISGRLKFLNPEGGEVNSAPKGSAIIVFRPGSGVLPTPMCSLIDTQGNLIE
jgi:phage N-6-adenine-methyltransferase